MAEDVKAATLNVAERILLDLRHLSVPAVLTADRG